MYTLSKTKPFSFAWQSDYEFLSNRLQTLAQWSLGIEVLCYDFVKNSQLFFRIYSEFSRSLCWWLSVQRGRCRQKPHEWNLDYHRGPLSEATQSTCTLWEPSTFNKLKCIGLYQIMFQWGASVAESCSALNQHLVFDMNIRTFQMLHINIELTVVIPPNTKRRRNVVLMFGQRRRQWYSIKPT